MQLAVAVIGNTFLRCLCVVSIVCSAAESEPDEYPTLVGRFAEETPRQPLVAEEAYVGDQNYFVRFSRGSDVVYGGGNWVGRISLEGVNSPDGSGPFILPLQYEQPERWNEIPAGTFPVRILDADLWRSLRERLFAKILAVEKHTGVVLDFGIDDYFLYLDGEGKIQATVIQNKPDDFTVAHRIAISDFMNIGLPILEAFLDEQQIPDRRIVFNTGDTGDYSLPFVFVNRDLPVAVLVRQPAKKNVAVAPSAAIPIVQTAGHIAQSHLGGIVFRPVSSVYRLFFVATDTIAETVTPDWTIALRKSPVPQLADGPGMDLELWEESLDDLTGRPSSRGTIDFLVDGEEFFTRFIDAATTASESIALRTYIFDNDDYAQKIGELLKRKSNAGVDVKVLLDGLGTMISTVEEQDSLPSDHQAPASVRAFLEQGSNVEVRQATNPWLTGDHVKVVVVDGQTAFTGGMNIAREYRYDWHDLMVELHGPVVDILGEDFNNAWAYAGFLGDYAYLLQKLSPRPKKAEDIGHPVRVLFTRTDDAEIFYAQREAIRNARSYIFVENAYFTDDAMLYELAKARRRGVDVRVIMPLVTDRGPLARDNALAANAMLEHGIRVFLYPGMSHVKAAVFDGWACLGSANWDRLSFRINREINIATSHSEAVQQLNSRLFETDFSRSVELLEPFPERWSDHLIEMVGDYVF
jgi:cardiolipin synthase